MQQPEIKRAIVLAGGGARGAYEAGVLSFLFEDLPKRLGRPIDFDNESAESDNGSRPRDLRASC